MGTTKSRTHSQPASGLLRLKPGRDLVASSVEAERQAFTQAMASGPKQVVLDLDGVQQIDSLGITLILGLYKSCQKEGIPFSIEKVQSDILRIFKLFSIPKLFPVTEAVPHE